MPFPWLHLAAAIDPTIPTLITAIVGGLIALAALVRGVQQDKRLAADHKDTASAASVDAMRRNYESMRVNYESITAAMSAEFERLNLRWQKAEDEAAECDRRCSGLEEQLVANSVVIHDLQVEVADLKRELARHA